MPNMLCSSSDEIAIPWGGFDRVFVNLTMPIRCLKRFLAREIYQRVMTDFRARQEIIQAA